MQAIIIRLCGITILKPFPDLIHIIDIKLNTNTVQYSTPVFTCSSDNTSLVG